MTAKLTKFFLSVLCNIKVYHWSTRSFSRHKASDDLYKKMDGLVDRYMEVSMAHRRRQVREAKMTTRQYKDYEIILYLRCVGNFLRKNKYKGRSELASIRDEMLEAISQAIYIFNTR